MRLTDTDELLKHYETCETDEGLYIHCAPVVTPTFINSLPIVDAVPKSVYDQVCWERDTAIEQLKEIGKSLGEKMDNVRKLQNGHWIPKNSRYREPFARNYYCSECGADPIGISNYCPNCGARMDGKDCME